MAPPRCWYCHAVVAGSLEPRVKSTQALVLSTVPPSSVPTGPEAVPVMMTLPYTMKPPAISSGCVQDIDVIETSTGWGVGLGAGVAIGVGDGGGVAVGGGIGVGVGVGVGVRVSVGVDVGVAAGTGDKGAPLPGQPPGL